MPPVPHGIAIVFTCLLLGVALYGFLTCFHPRWKRQLRWGHCGRRQCGPILSRWSHIVIGMWSITTSWVLLGNSFGIRGTAAAVCHLVSTLTTLAMFGGMIYDCLVYWRTPAAKEKEQSEQRPSAK